MFLSLHLCPQQLHRAQHSQCHLHLHKRRRKRRMLMNQSHLMEVSTAISHLPPPAPTCPVETLLPQRVSRTWMSSARPTHPCEPGFSTDCKIIGFCCCCIINILSIQGCGRGKLLPSVLHFIEHLTDVICTVCSVSHKSKNITDFVMVNYWRSWFSTVYFLIIEISGVSE